MAEKGVHFPSEMEHRKDVVGTLAVREGMSGLEDSTLSEDSSVFTLLFQQCVKPGETSVDINVLVEFIQRLRLGEGKEGEEVFDSHDSSGSGGMSFNLETLQKMLECACDQNRKIEKEAYLHIIKSWVKHVRETTGNMTQSPQQMAIVDSPSSDMPEMDRDISYGSYHDSRTSDSSVQSARHEAEETISRLQYEIKSLNEQNKSLMRQYDGSEESLKEYQARNTMLQAKLDEAMSNLAKLKELEFVNKDLSMMLSETKSMNEDLVRAKERLNREMDRMKNDYDNLEVTLSTTRLERDKFMDQLRSTQAVLTLTKEEEKESRTELEVKLNESRSQIVLMETNLDEADFRNAELKTTITDLEGQLQHLSMDQIVTSTPFRRGNKAVSILEEILDHEAEAAKEGGETYSSGEESSSRSVSPREGEDNIRRYRHVEVHESPEVEQFKERVSVKDGNIRCKTSYIMKELSDIGTPDESTPSYSTKSQMFSEDNFTLARKCQKTLKEKIMLKKENKILRKEKSDMLTRLQHLEAIVNDFQGSSGFGPAHFIEEDPLPTNQYHPAGSLRTPRTEQSETTPTLLATTRFHVDEEERSTPKKVYVPLTVPSSSHYESYQPPANSTSHVSVKIELHDSRSTLDSAVASSDNRSSEDVLQYQYLSEETQNSSVSESQQQMSPSVPSTSSEEAPCTYGGVQSEVVESLTSSLTSFTPETSQENWEATDSPLLVSGTAATEAFSPPRTADDASRLVTSAGGHMVLPRHLPPKTSDGASRPVTSGGHVIVPRHLPPRTAEDANRLVTSAGGHVVLPSLPATSVSRSRPEDSNVIYTPAIQGTISHPLVYSSNGTSGTIRDQQPPTRHEDTRISEEGAAAAINKAEDPIVYEQELPHVSNVSPRHLPASSVLQSRPEDSNVIYTPAVQHGTISCPSTYPSSGTIRDQQQPTEQEGPQISEEGGAAIYKAKDPIVYEQELPCVSEPQQEGITTVNKAEDSVVYEQELPSVSVPQQEGVTTVNKAEDSVVYVQELPCVSNPQQVTLVPLRGHKPQMVKPESLGKATVGVVNIKPYSEDFTNLGIIDRTDSSKNLELARVQESNTCTVDIGTNTEVPIECAGQATLLPTGRRFSLFGFLSNTLISLLIMVLLFFFVVLSVISHDAVERCGTFCPHSPVHVLYSTFEPYLQFTKVNPPL